MVTGKKYKLKLSTQRATVYLKQIEHVLDAADLTMDSQKKQIERHDVADCILQTIKPIAFDLSRDIAATGRFVIIDNYEIVGGGIITRHLSEDSLVSEHVDRREFSWEKSNIASLERAGRFGQKPKFIVVTGLADDLQMKFAKELEEKLFRGGYNVYYLTITNLLQGLDSDLGNPGDEREESIRRLGELARIFTDAGQIFITNIPGLDLYEIETLKTLNQPNEILVIDLEEELQKSGLGENIKENLTPLLEQVRKLLYQKDILLDYNI